MIANSTSFSCCAERTLDHPPITKFGPLAAAAGATAAAVVVVAGAAAASVTGFAAVVEGKEVEEKGEAGR